MDLENKILDLFLYNHKLKFNEIEKKLKIRSNKLAYHIKQLTKKGILEKEKDHYLLTDASEHLIPYLSKNKAMLPVILIHLGDEKQVFLYKRPKRPYKDKLSLPGGRILLGESLEDAAKRIMKNKFNINVRLKKINTVSLEHIKKRKNIVHSFVLIYVSVKTKNIVELIKLKGNKTKIIPSDYKLIEEDSDKETNIKTIYSKL